VKHDAGAVTDFEPGTIKTMELGGRSIGIVNAGDTFYAVLNVCPHELAPVCEGTLSGTTLPSRPGELEYGLENRILRCPWHRYEFDLADGGRSVFTKYRARLRLFPVTVEAGRVMVDVSSRGARRAAAQAST
jgi:nitrite reductase/ring-hydroxylating ferredoxin subunit